MTKKILLRPCVIVLSGLPLSGKTHLAQTLASITNARSLDVDGVRRTLRPSANQSAERDSLDHDLERNIMSEAYSELCRQAGMLVTAGEPVVVAGTFSRPEFKQPLHALIEALNSRGIHSKTFHLFISDYEAQRRITVRRTHGSLSNIDSWEKYQWAKSFFEKIAFMPIMEIDSGAPLLVERITEHVADLVHVQQNHNNL